MIRTRKRLLTFRVTEDEFEHLRTVAEQCGSRCLSDYLREAVLRASHRTTNGAATAFDDGAAAVRITRQLQNFEQRVNHLESRLDDFLAVSSSP